MKITIEDGVVLSNQEARPTNIRGKYYDDILTGDIVYKNPRPGELMPTEFIVIPKADWEAYREWIIRPREVNDINRCKIVPRDLK